MCVRQAHSPFFLFPRYRQHFQEDEVEVDEVDWRQHHVGLSSLVASSPRGIYSWFWRHPLTYDLLPVSFLDEPVRPGFSVTLDPAPRPTFFLLHRDQHIHSNYSDSAVLCRFRFA